ncbi:MAG TPA: ABC transporter permease [Anaerolineae bacterium]|nr:ABC transporter permease [Anaerolineae bacterium]MCB9104369.1 ABC transporter permease [Anaerolineales bacterium]HRV95279.1 ABC transporter permease [Anaerolineae bacterium]
MKPSLFTRVQFDRIIDALMPLIASMGALLVGAVVLMLLDVNPVEAYTAMFSGAFANKNGLADTMVKAVPLLLVGLGIVIAFRANVINIGAEGQLIVGALITTYLAVELGDTWPNYLVITLGIIAGTLMGALWAGIPGYLKAYLNVNEILSTIMMNQIAIQIGYFLLRGPMIDPKEVEAGTNIPHSARLPRPTDLPRFTDVAGWFGFTDSAKDLNLTGFWGELYGLLVEPTRLHTGFFIAIIMAILVYIFLWRTTIGYRIRAVGLNPAAARYAGIQVPRTIILSMGLSGAFAGLAGAVEILGLHHRMFEPLAVSAGYGFSGIVVALFGKLHPIGAIPASILFGGLLVGGDKMQRAVQVPQVFVTALLGLIVLFVVSSEIWSRRRARRRVAVQTTAEENE